MKNSRIYVFSAVLLLSSCANLNGSEHSYSEHGNGKNPPVDVQLVDFGPPRRYEEIKLDERELTAEIKSAIGVDNLATVIAYDFQGNVIAFDNADESSSKETIYPKRTTQLAKPYTVTFIPYEGSHCIDRIDSLGNARTRCLPPHN